MSTLNQLGRLPSQLKKQLLDIAERLPKHEAVIFLREAVTGISRFVIEEAKAHPRTVLYAVIGYGLSYAIRTTLENIPVLGPLFRFLPLEIADLVFAAFGGYHGFMRDTENQRIQARATEMMREALRKSQTAGGC